MRAVSCCLGHQWHVLGAALHAQRVQGWAVVYLLADALAHACRHNHFRGETRQPPIKLRRCGGCRQRRYCSAE